MLPEQWRKMSVEDKCCSIPENLNHGIDYDGSIIDGGWICSVCDKHWVGKGKNEFLNHELETPTEFGKAFMAASDDVIREGKHLNLTNVIGRMAFKDLDGTKAFFNQS